MAYLIAACITAADRAVPCRSDVAIFGEVGAMVLSAAAARTPESQVGCTGNLSSVADHAGRGCGGNPPPFSGRKAKALWSCQASPGAAGSCFVLAATREHGLFLLLQVPLQRRIEVAEYFARSNHRRSVRDCSNGVVLCRFRLEAGQGY